MTRRSTLYILAAALTFTLSAAAKPNFSGSWKMNAGKSDFGQMPAPDKFERKISHEEPTLKVSTTQSGQQGERTSDSTYTTDGKETTNKTGFGESKSVTKWDGDDLAIVTKIDFQGNEVTINEKWTLPADGKSMTIKRKINTPQGDFEQTTVMDKQ